MSTEPLRRHPHEAAIGAARAPADRSASTLPGRVLGNGHYLCVVTAAGTGAAWLDQVGLTPWHGDRVEDQDGWHLYLRDQDDGSFWTLGAHPAPRPADDYVVGGGAGSLTLTRRDGALESRMEVWVDPEAPLEYRVVTIRNHGDRARRLELTSYLEISLLAPAAHAAHPGFSKLFVQTDYDAASGMLTARRRPRGADERHPMLAQAFLDPGAEEVETDRMRFVGRGRDLSAPWAMAGSHSLSGSTGGVLDPVFALRRAVAIAPGAEARFALGLAAGAQAREVLQRVRSQAGRDRLAGLRASADAAASARADALGAGGRDPGALEAAILALLGAGPPGAPAGTSFRGALAELRARFELDPETALVLVEPGAPAGAIDRARAIHALAVAFGVPVAVMAIAETPRGGDVGSARETGFRFVAPKSIGADDLEGLRVLARVVLPETAAPRDPGPRFEERRDRIARAPATARGASAAPPWSWSEETLRCFNGYGGFSADGREYVVRMPRLADGTLHLPPRPWVNVIANPDFGCIVSERGAGSTWSGNSREFRLTPWSDDPVRDPHDEAFYLRDEGDGEFWSILPGPRPGEGAYEMRHGFGYSRCRHASRGLAIDTQVFVAPTTPVKVVRTRVTNTGEGPRRVSLFSYQRLVLGALPETSGRAVVTGLHPGAGILHARTLEGGDFAEGVAFAAAIADPETTTRFGTDRAAFLGAGGSPADPALLRAGGDLDGHADRRGDACFAIQLGLEIASGETRECAFLLGTAPDLDRARRRVTRGRRPGALEIAFRSTVARWSARVGRLQVETPVEAFDLLLNGWLVYQTLSCRIWGRTAFYQSGGAFGFRDQLQDAAALAVLDPEIARQQILLHARHQFTAGDVLHWWHPPRSRGIRTRFADDLLWLPLLTAHYIGCTGDFAVLETRLPYLEARGLEPGEDEAFVTPEVAAEEGDLYQHCRRAIDRSLATGAHGLPLFGTGDWNDGMNRVGREGRGESVWMGFFLYAVLGDFAPLCEARGEPEAARRYRDRREQLGRAIEQQAWDGAWYRRGYYDDGAPLGSRHGEECQIDALAQAWAVISGAAPRLRAERAMDEVEWHLISDRDGIVRLLAPPFDRTSHDPGYIKGYLPGVRENGGQYTHAALWVVRALLELGRRDRAAQVLELISPVSRTMSEEDVHIYQAEPYVVAADVYGEPPHVGRAGWTWYTGSAGWMLRVGLESLLGIRVMEGRTLQIRPSIPDHWPGFRVRIRPLAGLGVYDIHVENPGREAHKVIQMFLDGTSIEVGDGAGRIPLDLGEGDHQVRVVLGH